MRRSWILLPKKKYRKSYLRRKGGEITKTLTFFLILGYFFLELYIKIFQSGLSIDGVLRPTKIDPIYSMTKDIFKDYDFFYDYQIIEDLKRSDFSKCKLCPGIKQKPTSTSNDLALAVLYGKDVFNILTWVRTLRSTGCQCKILFFIEEGYQDNLNADEVEFLSDCGVVLWEIGNFSSGKIFDRRSAKYIPIQSFLEAYGNYFDRILVNDVFDSVFQMDPFAPEIPKDYVAVSIERVQFLFHNVSMMWVRSLDDNFSTKFWNTKFVINSGFEMGKTEVLLDLFHHMNTPKLLFANDTCDQGALNYVYYKGIFKKLWVDKKGQYFSSACYSKFSLVGDKNGYMHEKCCPQYTPRVIHQYDRINPVIQNLKKICPSLGVWQRYPYGRPGNIVQDTNGTSYTNNVIIVPEE